MTGKELRIVFLGTPDFAVLPLKTLVENGYNVVGVVTVPDKPAGRGLKVKQSPVKQYALSAGLPVLQPEKLKDAGFLEALHGWEPELGIVIAFRMLPEAVFAAPKFGTFNLHASLLPDYRGAAPINRAVMNGERVTGVTTFMLNAGMDTGDIIDSTRVEIAGEDTAGTLHDKLMEAGAALVLQSVNMIASGNLKLRPQPRSGVSNPAPKIYREDCYIRWGRPVDEIYNHIRGLSPHPAAWGYLVRNTDEPCVVAELNEEDERSVASCPAQDVLPGDTLQVKIYRASKEYHGHPGVYGTVITDGKSLLKVACNGGFIVIEELQAAGKRRMETAEFLRGFKDIADYGFA
ncbi:MAG: methionyl-tRNA formyltransferase [Rikenellaceae bacterium]|nr:methionyl-tRNA formyltransferase [Rikenellaceae bacterium]